MKAGLVRAFRMSASQLCLVLLCAFAVGPTLSAWLWYSSVPSVDPEPVIVPLVVEESPANDRLEPRVLDISDLPSHRLRAEAAVVKLPGKDPLAVVVLGASSNSGRFREVRRLVDWVSTKGESLLEPGTLRAD